jgi:hypothetical protein
VPTVIYETARRQEGSTLPVEVVGVVKQVNKPVDEEELALDALAAKRFRMGMILTAVILAVPVRVIWPIALNKPQPQPNPYRRPKPGHPARCSGRPSTWVLTWAHAERANRITNQRVWIDDRLTRTTSTEAAGPLSAKVER